MEKRKYEIPPRMRMPERPVLSDDELLEMYSDERFPENRAAIGKCLEDLLRGDTGRGSMPHVGDTLEDLRVILMTAKRRLHSNGT